MELAHLSPPRHPDHGFTLIEVLLVIVILGVLAAIVVFAVGNVSDDAGKNACAVEARSFATSIQAYKAGSAHRNQLPHGSNLSEVTASLVSEGLLSGDQVSHGVDGPATPNHWGFDANTGIVTPDAATCTA